MILQDLENRKLIHPPRWLTTNTCYLTYMGSVAYGVSSDTSDCDVYGACIPLKELVFPHLAGEISGFGRQAPRFEQWQEHHIMDVDALGGKGREYDLSIYNIVKYFQLCMDNNPNMIDSIYTPINCVLHITHVGNIIRENRKMFLHKGSYHKFLGYAHSQLGKILTKNHVGLDDVLAFEEQHSISHNTKLSEIQLEIENRKQSSPVNDKFIGLKDNILQEYCFLFEHMVSRSKRAENVKIQGFDLKFAYHLVRLADECEQILTLGDLDLSRAAEHMKAVRRGEVPLEELKKWFSERERTLEKMYAESKLQHTPDEQKIKSVLLQCLEEHYGDLSKAFVNPSAEKDALAQIQQIIDRLNIQNESL